LRKGKQIEGGLLQKKRGKREGRSVVLTWGRLKRRSTDPENERLKGGERIDRCSITEAGRKRFNAKEKMRARKHAKVNCTNLKSARKKEGQSTSEMGRKGTNVTRPSEQNRVDKKKKKMKVAE